MKRHLCGLAAALCFAPAAFGQFELYVLKGQSEQPVAAVFDLGSVYPGEEASALFRLRNTSMTPASLTYLSADGVGFSLPGKPSLPVTLQPQGAVDFTLSFSSSGTGKFSAALNSQGVAVIVTASVLPRLTYQVETASGLQTLSNAPIDFGQVTRGGSVARRFTIQNLTDLVLTVPAISVSGEGFSIGGVPSGQLMLPRQSAGFELQFAPRVSGPAEGALTIGDRSYSLTGSALEPPLPKPILAIDRAQKKLTVNLDVPSQTSGTGAVTLEFQGAADPSIQFATGGRTLPFTVGPGDAQGRFGDDTTAGFTTGTTAGTIVFTVSLGGVTDRQKIIVDPAAVTFTSVQGIRSPAAIELRIAGFDNTRTAGKISYSFFDNSGGVVPPGAIEIDSTADFSKYFQGSDAGGAFLLRTIFPVAGDVSKISGFEVKIANTMGTATTGRTAF